MTVEVLADADRPGLTVVDRIEGRRFPLTTDRRVEPSPASGDRFRDPVDAAVRFHVDELELPYVTGLYVRDDDGEMIAECHDFSGREFPAGEYEVEFPAPIKLYLRVSGPLAVRSANDEMCVEVAGGAAVALAARSYHERPAATVTTTASPEDLMAAVSTFGSALKTTSPERSFPSLRGHPPALELGDELAVPDVVAPPETGLVVEVPRERAAVYGVATLAHYLGARVRPGSEARLLADGSELRSLAGPGGRQAAVRRTLQQVFLLDCVVRTEGRYRLDLHERRELLDRVDLPLADLYQAPIAERVERYLDVPFETLRDLVPTWTLSTHLSTAPESVPLLPYAANALSLVSVERRDGGEASLSPPPGYRAFVAPDGAAPAGDAADVRYVRVSETDALERAWVGEGRAVNANDLYLAGVRNRRDGESAEGSVDIAVVCNDDRMAAEADGELYGDRDELPFDVTVHRDLSRADLRSLLARDCDFLHYVGHVECGGFVCPDGALDAGDLDDVGVDTFFLNGCRSYDQGRLLIERGSVGGIVTHGAVDNSNATAVGREVAGLLNAGYSLRSTLAVARYRHQIEGRYDVVGDGAVQVAQSENGTPNCIAVQRAPDGDGYEVRIETYPTLGTGMGACYTPYTPSVDRHFLVGGELPPLRLSLPEVVTLLGLERVPAIVDGEFRWSTDVAPGHLP